MRDGVSKKKRRRERYEVRDDEVTRLDSHPASVKAGFHGNLSTSDLKKCGKPHLVVEVASFQTR